jgi:hypothetical protein
MSIKSSSVKCSNLKPIDHLEWELDVGSGRVIMALNSHLHKGCEILEVDSINGRCAFYQLEDVQ